MTREEFNMGLVQVINQALPTVQPVDMVGVLELLKLDIVRMAQDRQRAAMGQQSSAPPIVIPRFRPPQIPPNGGQP